MTPVEPTPHAGAQIVIFAEDQAEYIPLPASVDANGTVMTEWAPTAEELERLLCGGRVRLWVHYAVGEQTCTACGEVIRRLLSPVAIEVIAPDCGISVRPQLGDNS